MGLEGSGTSFLGFVFSANRLIHFTTPRERQAGLEAWQGESFKKYCILQKGKDNFKGSDGK